MSFKEKLRAITTCPQCLGEGECFVHGCHAPFAPRVVKGHAYCDPHGFEWEAHYEKEAKTA